MAVGRVAVPDNSQDRTSTVVRATDRKFDLRGCVGVPCIPKRLLDPGKTHIAFLFPQLRLGFD